MATGDSIEMQRMQEEALRRAREMHERAQRTENAQAREEPPAAPEVPVSPPPDVRHETPVNMPMPSPGPSMPMQNALDSLLQDKERTLILLLLVLISSENNNELLFALMYLLM